MNSSYTQINQQLTSLLTFQQHFINLVHQHIYHSNSAFQENILKFQITHISEKNQEFNQMIALLAEELIIKKTIYDSQLKDKFQKIFEADYLPMMRINRFEITKVSLFGFDIYVQPLEAFLNIIGRIDSLSQKFKQSKVELKEKEAAECALEKGWDYYMQYSLSWKLSLNIYLLKEYLTVGSKSFLRKDREILFTGISQLYCALVPILKERQSLKLLVEFAQLNNALYQFHPSFNYFHFYSLLLPLDDQLEPIFSSIRQVAQKCLRTNILTPFLFGILWNRKELLSFIKQADSPIWLPYLNAIIAGVAINLKFRILQYEEILQIFEEAVYAAGLLGTIRTAQVLGKLEEGWKDAKQFFISACKIGFRNGDAETWKPVEFETIGPRIIGSLFDGMILGMSDNEQSLKLYLQNSQDRLQQAIRQISHNKIDLYFIRNTIYQLENNITEEKQVYALIRIVNLIKLNAFNQYSLHFVISCFNKIAINPNRVLKARLTQAAGVVNKMIFELSHANFTFLKDKIFDLHQLFPPTSNLQSIISLYFSCFEPKKCLTSLLALQIEQSKFEQYFLHIISKCIAQPSKKQIVVKTFYKQYITKSSYVNLSYQAHCLISILTHSVTKNSKQAIKSIDILVKVCPWIIFALLNFPVNIGDQLSSFSAWLIDNHQYHRLFEETVEQSNGKIMSEKGQDLIEQLLYPSMIDHLCKRINEADQRQVIKRLANLAVKLSINTNLKITSFATQLIALYFYILANTQEPNSIGQIVKKITMLATHAFKDKVKLWMMCLLHRRIEGKSQLSRAYRKRVLKTNNTNVYFLGQTLSNQDEPITYQKAATLKERLITALQRAKQMEPAQCQSILMSISKMEFKQFSELSTKQATQFLQQINLFDIPTLSETTLRMLFEANKYIALQLLSLNLENYINCIRIGIQSKDIGYLCQQRFDKNITKYIPQLLQLQTSTNSQILSVMSCKLSLTQKVTVAENYFLQASVLQSYCRQPKNLQYLSTLNNNNWRIVTDYYTKLFAQSQLHSLISQYHQFIKITGKQNLQYENTINQYTTHFDCFTSLLIFKIGSVFELAASKQELSLRCANELSSLNIIITPLNIKDILVNLSLLNKELMDRKINALQNWVSAVERLNTFINNKYQGDVLLSNFVNGLYFTNQTVYHTHKIQLGVFLQQYYRNLQIKLQTKHYYISQCKEQISLADFAKNTHSCSYVVSKVNFNHEQIGRRYAEIVKELQTKKIITRKGRSISLNLGLSLTERLLTQMYDLGCYQALVEKEYRFELAGLLESALQRKIISWDILKQKDSQAYLHIQSVLCDSQINKKSLKFVYKGKPLTGGGQGVRVNQYNRLDYCNLVGLKAIGQEPLQHLKYFMRGYCYQNQV